MENNDKLSNRLRAKIDNFLYHYKFQTIAVAFVVFVLLWVVISSFGQQGEEAYIGYIGEYAYSHSEIEEISEKMSGALGVDFNGDGKCTLEFQPYHYYASSQIEALSTMELKDGEDLQFHPELNRKNYEHFEKELESGSTSVWFVSKEVYDMMDRSVLIPVADILGYTPEKGLVDEYAIDCSSLPFSHDMTRAVTYNTYLVIRVKRSYSFIMGEDIAAQELEESIKLYRAIVDYKR